MVAFLGRALMMIVGAKGMVGYGLWGLFAFLLFFFVTATSHSFVLYNNPLWSPVLGVKICGFP